MAKVLFALFVIGVLVLTLACRGNSQSVSFQEAMENPELQERFVTQIVEEVGKPPYVESINYVNTPAEFKRLKEKYGYEPKPTHLMYTNGPKIPISEIGRKEWPQSIYILPKSFSGSPIRTEADFRSSLKHEYRHAETRNTGRIGTILYYPNFLTTTGEWNEALLRDVEELDALGLELREMISDGYFQNQVQGYVLHYLGLWEHSLETDPKLIKSLKVEFFHRGMLTHPYFFGRGKDWYFKNPATGKEYHLSSEEIHEIARRLRSRG